MCDITQSASQTEPRTKNLNIFTYIQPPSYPQSPSLHPTQCMSSLSDSSIAFVRQGVKLQFRIIEPYVLFLKMLRLEALLINNTNISASYTNRSSNHKFTLITSQYNYCDPWVILVKFPNCWFCTPKFGEVVAYSRKVILP